MAVISFAGAEHGLSGSFVEEGPSAGATVVSSPVKNGSYAYKVLPATSTTVDSFLFGGPDAAGTIGGNLAASTFFCEFWFRYATKSTHVNGEEFVDFRISGGSKGQLRIGSAGTVLIHNNVATYVATSTTVLAANTWYHIGYKGTTSASDSAYELRINGVTEASGTMAQGNTSFYGPRLGRHTNRNSTSVEYYYDDLIISDDAFLGPDYQVGLLIPEGHGASMSWTSGTGVSDFTQILERPASTAEYVKCVAAGNAVFRPLRQDICEIKAAKVIAVLAEDTAHTTNTSVGMISGGVASVTTGINLSSTSLQSLNKIYNTDPATSAAWHYGDLNEIHFGAFEGAAASVRLHWAGVGVVQKITTSALNLPPVSVVAQETGLGYPTNKFITAANFPISGIPTMVNHTVTAGAYSADLGFAWEANPTEGASTVLIAFGDTFGSRWRGPFAEFAGTTDVSTTAASPSNGADLSTMTGAGTLALASGTSWDDPGPDGFTYYHGSIKRASDSRVMYFAYQGISGASLTGVLYLGTSVETGSKTITTGDTVSSIRGWRGSTLARSTTANLSSGYTIDAFLPLDSNSAAAEVIPGTAHSADDATPGTGFRIYNTATSLSISNLESTNGYCVATTSADHGVTRRGQSFLIDGVTGSSAASLNNEHLVHQVLSPTKLAFLRFDVGTNASFTGTKTLRVATYADPEDPASGTEVSRIPTGAVAIPGAGAAGATRQYIFFVSPTHWGQGMLSNFLGIAYSDNAGDSWVTASGSGTVAAGSNGADVTTLTSLVGAGLGDIPTSGTVEVDTSTGYAYISYTGRSGSTLSGCNEVRGTGTLSTGGGVRYAMWGNNANFTDKYQAVWPWNHTDGYVYFMSIDGTYRYSEAFMSRCPSASILNISAWEFWTGAAWGTDKTAARPIFGDNRSNILNPGNLVAEPSFMYHAGIGKWVTTYFDVSQSGVRLRTADSPQGPWTRSQRVFDPTDYFTGTTAYGGMLHPWSGRSPNAAGSLFFHVSLTNPYNTVLLKTTLGPIVTSGAARGIGRGQVSTFGFSREITATGATITSGTAAARLTQALISTANSLTSGTMAARLLSAISSVGSTTSSGTLAARLAQALTTTGDSLTAGTMAANLLAAITASGATTTSGTVAARLLATITGSGSSTTAGSLAARLLATITASGATTSLGTLTVRVLAVISGIGAATSLGVLAARLLAAITGTGSTVSLGSLLAERQLGVMTIGQSSTVGSVSMNIVLPSEIHQLVASGNSITVGAVAAQVNIGWSIGTIPI